MTGLKNIKGALISVFAKDGLDELIHFLHKSKVKIYSTGGTKQYIEELKVPVTAVETLTGYPSILGGRVKTLHPKVFGGILSRRENPSDQEEVRDYEIPEIDLVIVDLYPFEETVAATDNENEIIEKIDIGGISLIRAAAKNFRDVTIISHKTQYTEFLEYLKENECTTSLEIRKEYAAEAFNISSHYDTAIFEYFRNDCFSQFKKSILNSSTLRYGENPHQKGVFFGNLDKMFDKLHGKELSYNNLLDIDAAIRLIVDFEESTFAILKHNNACGIASAENVSLAWERALAADPVSAFGGILIANREIQKETAELMNEIFFEVVIAPSYTDEALDILKQKKNRIILELLTANTGKMEFRSLLNGVIAQEKDLTIETEKNFAITTKLSPSEREVKDLIFANKVVKHSKSNTIVLVKDNSLLASGVGQTSRVDALKHAIDKAKSFGFDLQGAVMASDAFFPFADCVEIADKSGIKAVVQPGGSIRDKDSIEYCNDHGMSMVFTGVRHFKH